MSSYGIAEVVDIQEQEDGSAILTIELTGDALYKLAAIAVQKILTEQMEDVDNVD